MLWGKAIKKIPLTELQKHFVSKKTSYLELYQEPGHTKYN